MKKRILPVSSFDICLSNRCNLMCRYCYFDSINRGTPEFLDFSMVKRAVDAYVSLVSVRGIDKVSVAGGEPFLDFPLLSEIVRYIRKACGPKTDIEVFTNGTLAYPERLRELFRSRARIVFSIDGRKESNDINRIFKNGKGSVFDSVFRNLKGLTPAELGRICASMTVTAPTAPFLRENARFLREAGFGEVQINLNLLEKWRPGSLKALRKSVKELKTYYTELFRAAPRSFNDFRFGLEYILLKWDESLDESGVFKEISIAPDGNFYPCGLVSTYGPQKKVFAIGGLEKGFDIKKMRQMRKRAVRRIRGGDRGTGLLDYLPNPMLLYFEILLKRENLRAVFLNARKVFKIFYDEMAPFLRMERMFDIMSSDPLFGDFSHEPPLRADAEIGVLKVDLEKNRGKKPVVCACGKGRVGFPGLAEQRRALDFFLYSPGADKELVVRCEAPSSDFELAGLLSLYADLKARALGKNLRISGVFKPGTLGKEEREFMEAQGFVPVAELRAGGRESARGFRQAVLRFDPGRIPEALRSVRGLAASRVRRIRLEPEDTGSRTDRSLRRAADAFLNLMIGSASGGRWFLYDNLARITGEAGSSGDSRPVLYSGRDGKFRGQTSAAPEPGNFKKAMKAALLDKLREPKNFRVFKELLSRRI